MIQAVESNQDEVETLMREVYGRVIRRFDTPTFGRNLSDG